ncbi:hypothetical protein CRS_42210 [Chryseobacterium sp. ON_d1]|nr:hypothetical protein CRS_42210 [Chryseobacterium sp. ON_d1]
MGMAVPLGGYCRVPRRFIFQCSPLFSTVISKPLSYNIVSDCTIQWGVQPIAALELTRDVNFIHIDGLWVGRFYVLVELPAFGY